MILLAQESQYQSHSRLSDTEANTSKLNQISMKPSLVWVITKVLSRIFHNFNYFSFYQQSYKICSITYEISHKNVIIHDFNFV